VIDDIELCGAENPRGMGGSCELEPGHSGPHRCHNREGMPITFGERNPIVMRVPKGCPPYPEHMGDFLIWAHSMAIAWCRCGLPEHDAGPSQERMTVTDLIRSGGGTDADRRTAEGKACVQTVNVCARHHRNIESRKAGTTTTETRGGT
jgi:hypothetical protein